MKMKSKQLKFILPLCICAFAFLITGCVPYGNVTFDGKDDRIPCKNGYLYCSFVGTPFSEAESNIVYLDRGCDSTDYRFEVSVATAADKKAFEQEHELTHYNLTDEENDFAITELYCCFVDETFYAFTPCKPYRAYSMIEDDDIYNYVDDNQYYILLVGDLTYNFGDEPNHEIHSLDDEYFEETFSTFYMMCAHVSFQENTFRYKWHRFWSLFS